MRPEDGLGCGITEHRQRVYRPAARSFGYARLCMIVRSDERWVAVSDPRHDCEPSGY